MSADTVKTLSYRFGHGHRPRLILVFTGYTVAEGDEDPDGISIAADSLTLNGEHDREGGRRHRERDDHPCRGATDDAGQLVDGVRPTVFAKLFSGVAENYRPVMTWSEDLDSQSQVPPGIGVHV